MSVYILHLNSKLRHAQHYVGWAKYVEKRITNHKNGNGSKFTKACLKHGVSFELARVFEGADRTFERKLKNTNSTRDYCPICNGGKSKPYHPKPACPHERKIGDNYGISCQDCGERLEGYGFFAHKRNCWHRYLDSGDGYEVCIYCEQTREKVQR